MSICSATDELGPTMIEGKQGSVRLVEADVW
jgi:hypothetical protein